MPKKNKLSEQHESDYSFMRRCADKLDIPWQVMLSNKIFVDLIREARYSNMSVTETVRYFKDMLSEEKDVEKKTMVRTPGQNMDISKRSKAFKTPPCDLDSTA